MAEYVQKWKGNIGDGYSQFGWWLGYRRFDGGWAGVHDMAGSGLICPLRLMGWTK